MLSIGLIIAIIRALPKQLVSAGYDKAVEKFGQPAVDNFVNKVDTLIAIQNDNQILLNDVKILLTNAEQTRQDILTEE